MRLGVEWEQLRANARALGLTDERIDAVITEWRKTPYDHRHLWRMLILAATGVVDANSRSRLRPPVELCKRTSRHQGQELHLAVHRLGEALLATVPPEVRRRMGMREPVTDLQRSCSECGAPLLPQPTTSGS